jgi:iron(III) transport system ATP-binding protein
MPKLIVKNLSKNFGNVVAVDDISFEVEEGELLTLLGPSGCGKTTTLLCIAGLENPDKGSISIDESAITDIEKGINFRPEERNMGMVFQFYALWPNMTVYDNIAYALKLRKIPKDEIDIKVKEALDLVELPGQEKSYPYQLSGGMQQRVALARSLAYEPKILLLDEPLSNLDAKLRERARFWLKELQQRLGITTVYVTHDQAEAMALSDKIIIMDEGKIAQVGTPLEVYNQPANAFVADFLGSINFLEGSVISKPNGQGNCWTVDLNSGHKCQSTFETDLDIGDRVFFSTRSEDIEFVDEELKDNINVVPCEIIRSAYLGSHYDVWVNYGDKELRVETRKLPKNKKAWIYLPIEKTILLKQSME